MPAKTPEIVEVDPSNLYLPTQRRDGADPLKLARQIAKYEKSIDGMPLLLLVRGKDGHLRINDGVTRATRVAKLLPGTLITRRDHSRSSEARRHQRANRRGENAMNVPVQLDLIEMFRAFLSHYPSMRFGQALCAVASWENEDPTVVSDELLVSAVKENLESRFEDQAYEVANSSMSNELAAVLREARRMQPTVPMGKLLAHLAVKNNWNLYDMEDDDLIVALQVEISNAPKAPTRGQPVIA